MVVWLVNVGSFLRLFTLLLDFAGDSHIQGNQIVGIVITINLKKLFSSVNIECLLLYLTIKSVEYNGFKSPKR